MQTKKQSFIEALSNTAVGFCVSYASTFLIFPLVGMETSAGTNLLITVYFTIISIIRGYVIRRWFNKKPTVYVGSTPIVRTHKNECQHQNRTQHFSDVFGYYKSCLDCGKDL